MATFLGGAIELWGPTLSGNVRFRSDTAYILTLDHAASDNRTATIPDATDTLVMLSEAQSLANKTLTTPVIASLYQDAGKTKLLTMPAAVDTLVGRATTDELTNKTLNASVAKGTWTASGTWTLPALTLGGAVAGGAQAFTNVGNMTFAAGSALASGSTNGNTLLLKGNDTTFITLTTGATDSCTVSAVTVTGTWLLSGSWSIPAFTLASGNITMSTSTGFVSAVDNSNIQFRGGSASGGSGAYLILRGKSDGGGTADILTCNAAGSADVQRLQVTGSVANARLLLTALGVSSTFIAATIANNDSINAAPGAITLTAANAKSFTGVAWNSVLPAITPAADGAGITLTNWALSQGAIGNVADTEAITVKQITITGAAGAALVTGVYSWTGIDITTPAQAANGAVNTGFGLKITCGAAAGGAGAYQRAIDITMNAETDNAVMINAGKITFAPSAADIDCILPATDQRGNLGNDTYRWNLVRAVTISAGDVVFQNGWRITETDDGGIALLRPDRSEAKRWN